MRARLSLGLVFVLAAACAPKSEPYAAGPKPFSLPSKHGGAITGQADLPEKPGNTAVLMVAGTNPADRDNRFGYSRTDRDLIFKDLMHRITARGLATVRYDKRGWTWLEGKTPERGKRLPSDPKVLATVTPGSQADDFSKVYEWATSTNGLGARCVIVFMHSEGTVNVSLAAERGAPAPLMVIGMGPAMADKKSIIRWQMSQRDAESLYQMDTDKDGWTTEAEVRAGLSKTPSGVSGLIERYLPLPAWKEGWSKGAIENTRAAQERMYEELRRQTLEKADTDPYPDAQSVMASYAWWKSWFTDDVPGAKRLSAWNSPMSLHFAELDSQVVASANADAARRYLTPEQLRITVHPGVGHSLGPHVAYGPIDETIADQLADEAAEAAKACPTS
jgi:hypothetical protein